MADSPIRERLWAFIMQGEDLPYAGNRVDLDPTVRDARGFPVARVTYRPGRHELAASAHYGPRLRGHPEGDGGGVDGGHLLAGDRQRLVTGRPSPRAGTTWGRCGWAPIPATSVVDPTGRLHQFDNVVVADSSVFVTSAGYGPPSPWPPWPPGPPTSCSDPAPPATGPGRRSARARG